MAETFCFVIEMAAMMRVEVVEPVCPKDDVPTGIFFKKLSKLSS